MFFFVIAASLFPLALRPDPATLRAVGPGVLWVAALFAVLLSAPRVFAADHEHGVLEHLVLAPYPLSILVLVKIAAHWLATAVPLLLVAPLLALEFGLPWGAAGWLVVTLALGTPTLALLAAVSAALTLGVRAGSVLAALITLPLCVPVLVFGAAATQAAALGMNPIGAVSLLGACLLLALTCVPAAVSAALRIALE